MTKMRRKKKAKMVVDKGYRSKIKEEKDVFSCPNKMDSKELGEHKTQCCLQHESFNGGLKKFGMLLQNSIGSIVTCLL